MRMTYLHIKNFKVFKDIEFDGIPSCAVLIGQNGVGKSTVFEVFSFLYDCSTVGVKKAFEKLGGFENTVSSGDEKDEILIEYELMFDDGGKQRCAALFSCPSGDCVFTDKSSGTESGKSFPEFFGDIKILDINPEKEKNSPDFVRRAKRLFEKQPEIFAEAVKKTSCYIPGLSDVKIGSDFLGRSTLAFFDSDIEKPFLPDMISDGTVKIFSSLLTLYSPDKIPLLCAEEPEKAVYQSKLREFAEEFLTYSESCGGQVFINTHSPEFANAFEPEQVYFLSKKGGFTRAEHLSDNKIVVSLSESGDPVGETWRGMFSHFA